MKTINSRLYHCAGRVKSPVDGQYYYAFVCDKKDFSPETVLVKEARVVTDNGTSLFLDQVDDKDKSERRLRVYAEKIEALMKQ